MKIFLLLFSAILLHSYVSAQGCSDAGFCSMGALKPDQDFSKKVVIKPRSIELTQYVGMSTMDDLILSWILDFSLGIGKKNNLQIKLPYFYVSGPLAETHGVGDLSLSFTRTLISEDKYSLSATVGGKIPTNNSNFKEDGRPLPMYYQSSLGTYDIVAGLSLISKKWLVATGIQHPLNKNKNEFFWGQWKSSELTEQANLYPVSNFLDRGTDLMLRVERNFRLSRLNLFAGLLNIWRVSESEITSPKTGERVKNEESDGLAITAMAGAGYQFSVHNGLKYLYGYQLFNNHVNPDGLSRDWVHTITYFHRF